MRLSFRTFLTLGAMTAMSTTLSRPMQAQTISLDFDTYNGSSILDGTVVNNLFLPSGIAIAGTTPFSQQVQVTSLETPTNALDATASVVRLSLLPASTTTLTNLSLTVFGTVLGVTNAPVQFFDANGGLISTQFVDETSSTGNTYSFNIVGAQSVLLPADAYFDNLRVTAVPEPGLTTLAGVSLTSLLFARRLRYRSNK